MRLSERHRLWGTKCAAVDIDFFLEYWSKEPAALVEYKEIHAKPENCKGSAIDVQNALATYAKVPFFMVFYSIENLTFCVEPLNPYAWEKTERFEISQGVPNEKILEQKENGYIAMSEKGYVKLLYWLRGLPEPSKEEFEKLERGERMT